MMAILGLMGMAISAVFLIDTTSDEDTDGASTDTNGQGDGAAADVTPMNLVVYPDDYAPQLDAGATDESPVESDFDDMLDLRAFLNSELSAGAGDDTVLAGSGADYIAGDDGDDLLSGGAGDDTLYGGLADDFTSGGDDNDLVMGGVGQDTIMGDAGDDTLIGEDGDDLLSGGEGDDVLAGGAGTDTLVGGEGRDNLDGGDGDDLLIGAQGDSLTGGAGADRFQVADEATIEDYDPFDDVIEIVYEGSDPPDLTTKTDANGLTLFADGQVVAVLPGVTVLDLDQVALVAA